MRADPLAPVIAQLEALPRQHAKNDKPCFYPGNCLPCNLPEHQFIRADDLQAVITALRQPTFQPESEVMPSDSSHNDDAVAMSEQRAQLRRSALPTASSAVAGAQHPAENTASDGIARLRARESLIAKAHHWLAGNDEVPYGDTESERLLDVQHHNEAYDIIEELVLALQALANAAHPVAAAPAGPQEMQRWQAISTAPKDGTWILILDYGQLHQVRWSGVKNTDRVIAWRDCRDELFSEPTHWMSLPQFPKPSQDFRSGHNQIHEGQPVCQSFESHPVCILLCSHCWHSYEDHVRSGIDAVHPVAAALPARGEESELTYVPIAIHSSAVSCGGEERLRQFIENELHMKRMTKYQRDFLTKFADDLAGRGEEPAPPPTLNPFHSLSFLEQVYKLHTNMVSHASTVDDCDEWPCCLIGNPHPFISAPVKRRWNEAGECYICCENESHSNHAAALPEARPTPPTKEKSDG